VQLGVRVDTDVLFIERMSANSSVVNASLVGGRVPLHVSSSGLVLLAYGHRSIIDDVVATGMRPFTPHTIVDETELRRTLRRIRNDGFAVTHGHIHLESMGLAVPVYGADGVVSASMGAVIENTDGTPMAVVEVLNVAAAGMTRTLQLQGEQPPLGPPRANQVSQRSWEVIETLHRARAERAAHGPAAGH
ncbi:MAG: IclR family transcriptional regulator domain-containing protein, partial [Pseudoclavibacter sp.]